MNKGKIMYKNTLITVASILLVGGCAGKADFTQGVSEKDKKLISSYEDKVLFIYKDIRITKNGFYPNFKPLYKGASISMKFEKSKYRTNVASYLDAKKLNLKIFMDDVNRYGLKKIRAKLLAIFKRFPDFKLKDKEELEMILSEKNLKIVNSYIERKTNCKGSYTSEWMGGLKGSCILGAYEPEGYQPNEPSYSGSSSGGGYSSPSSGCSVQTVYVPGGNGRTAQTTICN